MNEITIILGSFTAFLCIPLLMIVGGIFIYQEWRRSERLAKRGLCNKLSVKRVKENRKLTTSTLEPFKCQIFSASLPSFTELHQDSADQSQARGFIWEDTNHSSSPVDLSANYL